MVRKLSHHVWVVQGVRGELHIILRVEANNLKISQQLQFFSLTVKDLDLEFLTSQKVPLSKH